MFQRRGSFGTGCWQDGGASTSSCGAPSTSFIGRTSSTCSTYRFRNRRLSEHSVECIADAVHCRATVIPHRLRIRRVHAHRRVCFEDDGPPRSVDAEINSDVIQLQSVNDLLERLPCLGADYALRMSEELCVFSTVRFARGHVGSEIMHLPVTRYCRMYGIEPAVDCEDPILADVTVRAVQVEIVDDEQLIAG